MALDEGLRCCVANSKPFRSTIGTADSTTSEYHATVSQSSSFVQRDKRKPATALWLFCDLRVPRAKIYFASGRYATPQIIMPCDCLAGIAFCPCFCIWPCCSLADCFVIPQCCPALPCIPLIPCCCAPCCPGVVDSGSNGRPSSTAGLASMPDSKYMPIDDTTTYKLEK